MLLGKWQERYLCNAIRLEIRVLREARAKPDVYGIRYTADLERRISLLWSVRKAMRHFAE